jgi:hypothetical protein
VFTRHLVDAIRTGAADLDEDGDIALDELYSYVRERVVAEMPQQRPKKQEDVDGRILIARNVHWALPAHLQHAIDSPIAAQRVTAVEGLVHLHRVGNAVVRAAVRERLTALSDDDSRKVSAAAAAVLAGLDGAAVPAPPPVDRSEARGAAPEQPARLSTARRGPASPRGSTSPRSAVPVPALDQPDVAGPPPAARRARPSSQVAPGHPTVVTAASSEDLGAPAQGRAPRRLRLPVALLEVAVLPLITTRALEFESTNGYQFSDFGFGVDLLVGYLLPLCGAIVLLLFVLGVSSSVPPDWFVPAATGLATGAILCVAVEVLSTTTLLVAMTSGYRPGPGYWVLLGGFVVLAAAGSVLLGRGGLAGRPAFARDAGTVAAPLVLVALAVAVSRVPGDLTDVDYWLTFYGPMTLLAGLGLVLTVLQLDRRQSLAGLVALTVFGVWLGWFLLVVTPVLMGDPGVVTVACLVAVVLAAHGAQFWRRRGSVGDASVPTGGRR